MKTLNLPFRRPIVNDHYGYDFLDRDAKGRFHPGEDLNGAGAGAADKGLKVMSIGLGIVSFVDTEGDNSGWGKICYVRHDMVAYFKAFGLELPSWCPKVVFSQYAHMHDIFVSEGDEVNADTILGELGGTPYWSPHLHHEVRKMPLGVFFYPSARTSKEWMLDHYFQPRDFVRRVNSYVAENQEDTIDLTVGLIKSGGQSEVWFYNGKRRFWIPDEETAIALFGADWANEIQETDRKTIGMIATGDQFPSLKINT